MGRDGCRNYSQSARDATGAARTTAARGTRAGFHLAKRVEKMKGNPEPGGNFSEGSKATAGTKLQPDRSSSQLQKAELKAAPGSDAGLGATTFPCLRGGQLRTSRATKAGTLETRNK